MNILLRKGGGGWGGRERQRGLKDAVQPSLPLDIVASCSPSEAHSRLKFINLLFQLVIETRATGGYRGDIAIDDFTITGAVCTGERECITK